MEDSLLANDAAPLEPSDTFARRHIGPSDTELGEMLARVGSDSLDALIDAAVPASIRRGHSAPASAWATRTPWSRR
jgi:glycine dehydrogenase